MTTGMTTGSLDETITVSWNRPEFIEEVLRRHHHEIACVLMEPIMGNTGVIEPEPGYLQFVRNLPLSLGSYWCLMRLSQASEYLLAEPRIVWVTPDLCTLAKALGGGFPVAAFGGSKEVMELEATNEVFHGGTYSGNPMVLAASEAVLT